MTPAKCFRDVPWLARGALAEAEANLRDALWAVTTTSQRIGAPVIAAYLADILSMPALHCVARLGTGSRTSICAVASSWLRPAVLHHSSNVRRLNFALAAPGPPHIAPSGPDAFTPSERRLTELAPCRLLRPRPRSSVVHHHKHRRDTSHVDLSQTRHHWPGRAYQRFFQLHLITLRPVPARVTVYRRAVAVILDYDSSYRRVWVVDAYQCDVADSRRAQRTDSAGYARCGIVPLSFVVVEGGAVRWTDPAV